MNGDQPVGNLGRLLKVILIAAVATGAVVATVFYLGSQISASPPTAASATTSGTIISSSSSTGGTVADGSTSRSTATTSTTVNTISSPTSPPSCNEDVYNSKTELTMANVPVLLMQPGSTASICVTYQTSWQGNSSQYNSEFFVNDTYGFSLWIGEEHCAPVGAAETQCGPVLSHSFVISASPATIQPSPTTDYVSVVYTVTALSNSTGFYDRSAPYDYCIGMPLAVGYSASQVNASDFDPIVIPPCALQPFAPVGVSVGGMGVIYIPFASEAETS